MNRFLSYSFVAAVMFIAALLSGCAGGGRSGLPAAPVKAKPSGPPSLVWKAIALPREAAGVALNQVYFLDDTTGWIVGDKGLCLATRDGGAAWQIVKTGSAANLRAVRFIDAGTGWLLGDGDPAAPPARGHVVMGTGKPNTSGTLLSTTDGGKTWKRRWMLTNFELTAIDTPDGKAMQIGHSGGANHPDGDLIVSANGGKDWSARRAYRALLDVRTLDATRWVAVGSCVSVMFFPSPDEPLYTRGAARAIYSSDGGQTWSVAEGSDARPGPMLRRLAWRKGLPLLAVGDRGAILISDDAGAHWKPAQRSVSGNLRGVAWGNGDSPLALAVGVGGTAALSANGGKNWTSAEAGTTTSLNSVCAAGKDFIAVGENGLALKATP